MSRPTRFLLEAFLNMLVSPHRSSALLVLLTKAGTGLLRSRQLSFDEFRSGRRVGFDQVHDFFVSKVVKEGVQLNGKRSGRCQQRTVAVIRYGRNEAHRAPSPVGDDQLPEALRPP